MAEASTPLAAKWDDGREFGQRHGIDPKQLHGVDPQAYLTDVIARLQGGWPQSRVDELLPPQWNEARKGNRADEHVDDQAEAES